MARFDLAHSRLFRELRENRKWIAASVAAHVIVLSLAFLLPSFAPSREVIVPVVRPPVAATTGGAGASPGGAIAAESSATTAPEIPAAQAVSPPTQIAAADPPAEPAQPEPAVPLPQPPVARPAKAAPPQVLEEKTAAAPTPPVEHFLPMPLKTEPPAPDAQVATAPDGTGAPESWSAPSPPAEPRGEAHGTGAAGSSLASLGPGHGPGEDYFERLRRHLAAYKRYPPDAARRNQEGTVVVRFDVARDGRVLSANVERSSGFPLLDRAVLEMLGKASPVPVLPADFAPDRGSIVMPIDFKLGFFEKLF